MIVHCQRIYKGELHTFYVDEEKVKGKVKERPGALGKE